VGAVKPPRIRCFDGSENKNKVKAVKPLQNRCLAVQVNEAEKIVKQRPLSLCRTVITTVLEVKMNEVIRPQRYE
jgi:hypothetical protein